MAINIKQQLQKIKGQGDKNLDDHLKNILSKVLIEKPKNSFEVFEDYSHQVKLTKADFRKNDDQSDNANRIRERNGELKAATEISRKLLDKLNDGADEPQDVGAIGYVPNFMDEAKWFEQAGVGFGQEESYRIFKSLATLSYKKAAKQMRLWGKILGSKKDYWVAEGTVDGGEDGQGEYPPNVEAKGTGVNKQNYFVTTNLESEWTELPIVTPEQISVSRRIKRLFTGDLESAVITNPHFKGQEKHLLKCQIIRISHTTNIIPAGLYVIPNPEAPREIEPPEEEKKLDYQNQTKLSNWVHYSEAILKEGRITHSMPEQIPIENMEPEEYQKLLESKDPFEKRLKSLTDDKAPEGYQSAWTIKTYGDQTQYALYQKEVQGQTNLVTYGYIALKNLHWPGQITVYHKDKWQSLYIGYGFKQSNQLYYPQEPEYVFEEQPDLVCQADPNFPVEVEKQADDGVDKQNNDDDQ